jgi:hypothetical protein
MCLRIALMAPLRAHSPRFTPLMRVCAENGTKVAPRRGCHARARVTDLMPQRQVAGFAMQVFLGAGSRKDNPG